MPFLLIKQLAPYIVYLMIAGALWSHGFYTADKHRIELVARLQAESDALVKQANESNAAKVKQIDASNKRIEEASNANRQIIETLADRNRDLAKRVRVTASCSSGAVPNNTATTESGTGTDTGTGQLFEPLVQLANSADRVTETARACQNYVKSLEIMK